MHQELPRCYLNMECSSKGMEDDPMYEFVTKVVPLPCYPALARHGRSFAGSVCINLMRAPVILFRKG